MKKKILFIFTVLFVPVSAHLLTSHPSETAACLVIAISAGGYLALKWVFSAKRYGKCSGCHECGCSKTKIDATHAENPELR